MSRLPLAVGLALAIIAAGVAQISITPKSAGPIVVDMNQYVNRLPYNITLPAVPDVIHVVNITGKDFCIHIAIPGGIVVNVYYGDTWVDVVWMGCYYRTNTYDYSEFYVTFNGTQLREWWDYGFRVVKPPEKFVIMLRPRR